jgi:hypothetical protein
MTEPIEVPYIKVSYCPECDTTDTKSIKFFIIIFPVFFDLVNPVSTSVKPACMKTLKFRRLIPTLSLIQHSYP